MNGPTIFSPETLKPLTVVTGHYGVGKTNVVINLALDLKKAGHAVTVVDLDIVNPYFRSSDYAALLEEAGVTVIAPTFARTTLDTPTLGPEVSGSFERHGYVLVDAGGDDVGATALGRYRHLIDTRPFDLLYVVNANRNLTQKPDQAVEVLREIEAACGLRATGIVNNTHLQNETTCETIAHGLSFGEACADQAGLPQVFVTVPRNLNYSGSDLLPEWWYPTEVYVKPPW